MNIRSITILLIIFLLVTPILIIGCGGSGDATEELAQTPSQTEQDGIDTIAEQDIDQAIAEMESQWEENCDRSTGEWASYDTDGDGTDDKWDTSFGQDEIEEGLYVQDDMSFEMTESGLQGELIITFENKGDTDYLGYEYIVEIPKSFAETVDDIEFSVPPNEVINADFIGKFVVDIMDKGKKAIKGAATELKFKAAIKMIEMDPSIVMDRVRADYWKVRCKRLPNSTTRRVYCMFGVAKRFNDPSICDAIDKSFNLPDAPIFTDAEIQKARRDCREYVKSKTDVLPVTTTPTPIPALPLKIQIQVPDGSLRMGEEVTFKASHTQGTLPENPYYEWDFDDSSGIGIPFSNEAIHLFTNEGTYVIYVELRDGPGEHTNVIATAKVTVEVEASANHLAEIHEMNRFSLSFAVAETTLGGSTYRFSRTWNALGEAIWDGVNFSMQGEQGPRSQRMSGRVSEDGTRIKQLKFRENFVASNGENQWQEIEIAGLSFWEDTMPDRFVVQVDDEAVGDYVTYFNTYRTSTYVWDDNAVLYVQFKNK